MQHGQFVAPEHVGLSHNRFGSETVFGQFGFHFFLVLWAFKPSLRQPFYCVIAIKGLHPSSGSTSVSTALSAVLNEIANRFAIARRCRKISQEVSVMWRTNSHP